MSPLADPMIAALCAAVSESGPHELQWLTGDGTTDALLAGQVELGWVCGLLHARRLAGKGWPCRAFAAPQIGVVDGGDGPRYAGDIVVAADSSVTRFRELAGATFVFNEPSSLSGHDMMVHRLAQLHVGFEWFGRVIESGSHLDSIACVLDGTADCAVIDSTVLAMLAVLDPTDRAQVRVVERVGPYPAPPFVISQTVPRAVRENVTAAMRRVGSDGQTLAGWQVQAIDPVDDERYRPLLAGP